jgi:hypothetical protein
MPGINLPATARTGIPRLVRGRAATGSAGQRWEKTSIEEPSRGRLWRGNLISLGSNVP